MNSNLSTLKAVCYCRYSSDNQRDESIDAQLRAIEAYAQHNGYEIIKHYIDRAKTGTHARREEFQKMIEDSKKGKFKYVIVHKLDRFARSRNDTFTYGAKLKRNGVTLISVSEPINDGTPSSMILEAVISALAEYYSLNLSVEVKKGLKENALKCMYTGGKVTYGYKINNEKKYEILEEEAQNVQIVFDMYANGKTYGEILKVLETRSAKSRSGKPFSKNAIGDMLDNIKYIGVYAYNVRQAKNEEGRRNSPAKKDESEIIMKEGGVPRIVSDEVFAKAQQRKNLNRYGTRSKGCEHEYLLTGLIKCDCCGHAMTGNTKYAGRNKTKYVTYRCTNRYRAEHKCKNKEVNLFYLESFILEPVDIK